MASVSVNILETFVEYADVLLVKKGLSLRDQNNLKVVFCILQLLNSNYRIDNKDVVDCAICSARRFLNPTEGDWFMDPRTLIAVIDFLWETITWSEYNKHHFMEVGGVYLLLDITEV